MSEKDLSVNQRIKFLIEDHLVLTQRAFAKRTGISQSAVSSLFSQRENRPGLEMLQKIAIAYPEISLEWLLIGQGEMLKQEDKPSRIKQLEITAKKLLDKRTDSGQFIGKLVRTPDESRLLELLSYEEELRHIINSHRHRESSDYTQSLDLESDSERQKSIAILRESAERSYIFTVQMRMHAERQMLRQEVSTIVYQVEGEPDPSKTYGGLLSKRLDISEESALQLVKDGFIRSAFIDGEGYRVTEQAVREFFGEA